MWASMKAEDGILEVHREEDKPSLRQMQQAVGGYVEEFDVLHGSVMMWCNEESKLVEDPVPNPKATWLMQRENGGPGMFRGDYIAGDVVFTGPADEDGETTGLAEHSLEELRGAKRLFLMGQQPEKLLDGDLVSILETPIRL